MQPVTRPQNSPVVQRLPDTLKALTTIAEPFPRWAGVGDNLAALTSGQLFLTACDIPAGSLITNITFNSGGTALATATNFWFALYDNLLNLLRQTADQGAGAWGANVAKVLALSSTFTTTYSGLHYVGVMVAATTVPTLKGKASVSAINGGAPILAGTSTGALTTTAPNPAAALTNNGNVPYFTLT